MSYTNFPSGITSMGIPIPAITMGKVFFVDLENGSDGNRGISAEKPFLTITKALAQCVTDRGDIIFVGGKSTITSAISISSLDNVSIIGIPNSNTPHGSQPRIANSSCNIFEITNSHKVHIDGLRLTVTGAYSGITLAGGNGCFQTVIRDLAFQLNGANAKGLSSSVANAPQAGTYENLYFRGYAVAKSSHGVHFSNTSTGNLFRNCYFYNISNGIIATDSNKDIIHDCFAIDCTASFNITGTTSMVTRCFSDVAPVGTALAGGNTTVA